MGFRQCASMPIHLCRNRERPARTAYRSRLNPQISGERGHLCLFERRVGEGREMHVAAEHVEYLRQLIEAIFAQN